MWTKFSDMHSGGISKERWDRIYIEAPRAEAKAIFYNRFGHNPERVSCTCCGSDYSIHEHETLEQASAYERNCRFISDTKNRGEGRYIEDDESVPDGYRESEFAPHGDYITLKDYEAKEDVLVIPKKDIKPDERKGDVPVQGYVWT
jgi:hypothetical protein